MAWGFTPRMKPSDLITLGLVVEYLEEKGWDCFTYRGLRAWLLYDRPQKPPIDWHTVERSVRSLVGYGYLIRVVKRKGKKRITVFCKGRYWQEALEKARSTRG